MRLAFQLLQRKLVPGPGIVTAIFARTYQGPLARETERSCTPRSWYYLRLDKPYSSSSSSAMEKIDTGKRLEHLRTLMREHKVDVYSITSTSSTTSNAATDAPAVVPTEDSHQSEYVAPCDARRGKHFRPDPGLRGLQLTTTRIHLRLLWFRWLCGSQPRQSIPGHRWTLLQPGRKAAGQQLDTLETRAAGRADMAGVVGSSCISHNCGLLLNHRCRTAEQAQNGGTVGVDPSLITAREWGTRECVDGLILTCSS